MGWPYPHGVTVTVHRASHDPRTQERGAESTHELEHCLHDPGTTRRDVTVGASITTNPTVYAAYGADVTEVDELTVPGTTGRWQIDGDILRHRNNRTGRAACSEIRLTRKRGQR